MSATTFKEWPQHVLNDHFPPWRDCKTTCILNCSRSKAHMRVTRLVAWMLSLDLDACAFPVSRRGQALVKPWEFKGQVGPVEVDQPLSS